MLITTCHLGAVLAQIQKGVERVIAYASNHNLKFLALKLVATEKFYDHLYGHQFTVLIYNNLQS